MRLRTLLLSSLLAISFPAATLVAQMPVATPPSADDHLLRSRGSDWDLIAPHLPDTTTASAERLELAGDVLKARRFPEDALDYYELALKRGGSENRLLKKMGVARLELQQHAAARALFVRCVRASKKDAMAWNNLGATDYSMGAYRASISEYKHAVKLEKMSAVFHSNLGMAYFGDKDMEDARVQFAIAMRLDPTIMEEHANGGMTLRILESKDYARLSFEMAKTYAKAGMIEAAKIWLQKASEHGLDLRQAMSDDATMRPWMKYPDIQVMLENSKRIQRHVATAVVPTLGAASDASVPN
jgi:tetratricopeptide (TPR) repeat protein